MQELGKLIISLGFLIIIFGILISNYKEIPLLGKLPGDILIKKKDFTFYAPITTSIIVSIILTILFFIISNLKK